MTVRTYDSLFEKSGENSDCEADLIASNISATDGDVWIEPQNGEWLKKGHAVGDVTEEFVERTDS